MMLFIKNLSLTGLTGAPMFHSICSFFIKGSKNSPDGNVSLIGMPLCLIPHCFISRIGADRSDTLFHCHGDGERKCIKRAFKLCWLPKSRAWTSASWVRDILVFDALLHDSQMFRNVRRCYLSPNCSQNTYYLEYGVKIYNR